MKFIQFTTNGQFELSKTSNTTTVSPALADNHADQSDRTRHLGRPAAWTCHVLRHELRLELFRRRHDLQPVLQLEPYGILAAFCANSFKICFFNKNGFANHPEAGGLVQYDNVIMLCWYS